MTPQKSYLSSELKRLNATLHPCSSFIFCLPYISIAYPSLLLIYLEFITYIHWHHHLLRKGNHHRSPWILQPSPMSLSEICSLVLLCEHSRSPLPCLKPFSGSHCFWTGSIFLELPIRPWRLHHHGLLLCVHITETTDPNHVHSCDASNCQVCIPAFHHVSLLLWKHPLDSV